MRFLRTALIGLLALLAAPAAAQLPNIQDQAVWGRIGNKLNPSSGPSQAIPFATLAAQLATAAVGGSNTQAQYNNNGVFGGIPGFTYNGTTLTLPAFTAGGTVNFGGNQLNNVIIGNVTPLAGAFTNLLAGGTTIMGTNASLPGGGSTVAAVNGNTGNAINAMAGFGPQFVVVGPDGNRGAMALQSYMQSTAGNESSYLAFTARGAMNAPAPIQAGDFLGEFFAHGYGSGQFLHNAGCGLIMVATDNYTSTTAGEKMTWWCTPTGTGTAVQGGTFEASGAITMIGATGGDKGAGTINAQALYINGTALSALAANLTVGTSTITGGGAGKVLFDSGPGTLGEYSISGTGNVAMTTSPAFTTPNVGAATATSINGNTLTTGTWTLTGVAAKTLTFSNSLTLAGTDATTMTFPTTTATIARTDAAQTFTGTQTFPGGSFGTPGITIGAAGYGLFQATNQIGISLNGGIVMDYGFTTVGTFTFGAPTVVNGSIKSNLGTGGIGYATGTGGAVTQTSSRTTTTPAINKVTGQITLVSAAGSATPFSFSVANTAIAATDTVQVVQLSGTDRYRVDVTKITAGTSFDLTVTDLTGTTVEQPVFNFTIVKGVNSFLMKRDIDPASNDNDPAFTMEKAA